MNRLLKLVAPLALAALPDLADAQQTRRFDELTHQYWREGMNIAVYIQVDIDWTPPSAGDLFSNRMVNVRMTELRGTFMRRIEVDGRTYDERSFDGALIPYFDALQVTNVGMGLDLNGTRDCTRFGLAVWAVGDVRQNFCIVYNPPLQAVEWRVSSVTIKGFDELKRAIARLNREKREAEERKQREEQAKEIEEARVDSIATHAIDSGDSTAIRRDTAVARAASNIRRERERRRVEQDFYRARAQHYIRICQQADAAYSEGNSIRAAELYAEIKSASASGSVSRECAGVAERRYQDAVMTSFATGYTSLLKAVGETFNISVGPVFASFPLPRDEFGGGAFGIELGKSVYTFDLLMGNHVWGPVLEAFASPGPPDLSSIGCYGPSGNDYWGSPCADYYTDPDAAPRRYRVKWALGAGIVSPKGLGPIFPTANLNYVFTDDGNLIIPALGIVWADDTDEVPRWGRVYAGSGIRLGVTMHQGSLGWQAGLHMKW